MDNLSNVNQRQLNTIRKVARRLAFSKCLTKRATEHGADQAAEWNCCEEQYHSREDIQRHVSRKHSAEVDSECENILKDVKSVLPTGQLLNVLKQKSKGSVGSGPAEDDAPDSEEASLPADFASDDVYPWLPTVDGRPTAQDSMEGRMLLFYQYRSVHNTKHLCEWQRALCKRLGLTGKIRVAKEGINATIGGTVWATEVYMDAMHNHPLFNSMTDWDFKRSAGSAASFPDGLKVAIYSEICPMGVDPTQCSPLDGGVHLTVDDFHKAAEDYLSDENEREHAVFVDCRNFYESDIGQFEEALKPDIRKFSYWPEYVDKNVEIFRDKDVFMYCTGGIRCERGSAYLKAKGVCRGVYQLQGGIHKYIEKYPEGHFRGKMFVFDDRYYIKANDDVLSKCRYCGTPWDQHRVCSIDHCHQLVLSCQHCIEQGLTACCPRCRDNAQQAENKEECDCTANRPRIPIEAVAQ